MQIYCSLFTVLIVGKCICLRFSARMVSSGTNDTRLILPVQVTQKQSSIPELMSTNGCMLELIANIPEVCLEVDDAEDAIKQAILGPIPCHCLIDAGALTASMKPNDVATRILTLLAQRESGHRDDSLVPCLRGVAFFENDEWIVRTHDGSRYSKEASPLPDKALFVFYDEEHCRGSDFKLHRCARGMVTIGPR